MPMTPFCPGLYWLRYSLTAAACASRRLCPQRKRASSPRFCEGGKPPPPYCRPHVIQGSLKVTQALTLLYVVVVAMLSWL